jgi:hypothetical protein
MSKMQNDRQAEGRPAQTAPAKPRQTSRPPRPTPPPGLRAEELDGLSQAELIRLLKDPGATVFQKAKSCQRLAQTGTRDAVPAMAALLNDEKLGVYVRFGMEPIPDPSVDDAFRAALAETKGGPLVGLLNSIGFRRDRKPVAEVARLMYSPDLEVAKAAAAALGKISGPGAAKALREGLSRTDGPVRAAVAEACLVCAGGLLAQGERDAGLAMYEVLIRGDAPKPIRLAAMRQVIAAEISLSRPR